MEVLKNKSLIIGEGGDLEIDHLGDAKTQAYQGWVHLLWCGLPPCSSRERTNRVKNKHLARCGVDPPTVDSVTCSDWNGFSLVG